MINKVVRNRFDVLWQILCDMTGFENIPECFEIDSNGSQALVIVVALCMREHVYIPVKRCSKPMLILIRVGFDHFPGPAEMDHLHLTIAINVEHCVNGLVSNPVSLSVSN